MLEYAINGLPVVATDMPRLRKETHLNDGLHFVDWIAPDAMLVDAMQAAALMGAGARQQLCVNVVAHYNWANEAEGLRTFYITIL